MLVLLLAAAVGVVVAAVVTNAPSGVAIGAVSVFIAVAGVFAGLLQWRRGLEAAALEGLYERIVLANKMRLAAFEGLGAVDEFVAADRRPDDYTFYVFTEVDSLEIAVERYRLGLGMTERVGDRAVRHFRRRCERSAAFRDRAKNCVASGAYFDSTRDVVRKIVDTVDAGQASPSIAEMVEASSAATRAAGGSS